ncbi:FecR family protein [Mangrovibacterium marinum]|nr:FecR domain-containing protein [Mangrovibacterium marinum]
MGDRKKAIDNFFRGKYSRKDYFSIQSEFEKEKADEDFLFELEQQWDTLKDEPAEGFHRQTVWNNVVNHLDFNQAGKVRKLSFLTVFQRVAAILFIPLAIGFLFYVYTSKSVRQTEAWAEITCPPGVRTEFHLPDGSTGVLNGDSRLKYAVNFSSNRTVELVGQAYFDVVKDKKHPFNVATDQLNVQVLGTTFSVLAYPGQAREEVVLKTGKVNVSTADQKPLAQLSPDQQFVLDTENRKYYTTNVNATALVSWIEGRLVFKNESFDAVAERLSQWYNVEIEIADANLKKYKYYGTFENESIEEVLHLLKLTAPIKYKEIDRVKLDNGTFSKRKIIFATDEKRVNDFN